MLVDIGESVVLVALDGDRLLAVRQTRPGAPERTLELPSGAVEPGETPQECAARELAEECGLAAAGYRELASFRAAPSYSTELCHVLELDGPLRPVESRPDEDEDIEVEWIPLAEAYERLSDAGSLAALALWERSTRAGRARRPGRRGPRRAP